MSTNNPSPFDDASGQEFLKWLAAVGGPQFLVQETLPAGTTAADAPIIHPGLIAFGNVSSFPAVGSGLKLSSGAKPGQLWIISAYWATNPNYVYPPSSDIVWWDDTGVYTPGQPANIKGGWAVFFYTGTKYGFFGNVNPVP